MFIPSCKNPPKNPPKILQEIFSPAGQIDVQLILQKSSYNVANFVGAFLIVAKSGNSLASKEQTNNPLYDKQANKQKTNKQTNKNKERNKQKQTNKQSGNSLTSKEQTNIPLYDKQTGCFFNCFWNWGGPVKKPPCMRRSEDVLSHYLQKGKRLQDRMFNIQFFVCACL